MFIKLAFRNLFRQKHRTLLTFLSMLGGFVLVSLAISWENGSYARVIDMFTRVMVGHIQVFSEDYFDKPSMYKNIQDYREVIKIIEQNPAVEACCPRILSGGLASVDDKTAGVQVIGIDPELENTATKFNSRIEAGRPFGSKPEYQAIIGKSLARFLEAGIDDSLVIISQAADGSMANEIYHIVGLYSSGDDMADRSMVYLHIEDAEELFVLDNRAHQIQINLRNIRHLPSAHRDIQLALEDRNLTALRWETVASSFYNAMKADQDGTYVAMLIIYIIVAVGILNTVVMNVLERTKEFGVLKALGTRPSKIFKMIMTEVCILAVSAIVLGSGIVTVIVLIIESIGIKLSNPIDVGGFMMYEIAPKIVPEQYWISTLIVFFCSMLVAIIPAVRAAQIQPSKALRSV